jgi:hypothetical protein
LSAAFAACGKAGGAAHGLIRSLIDEAMADGPMTFAVGVANSPLGKAYAALAA